MTQKDIKDIKLGASDVQHLMFRYWEVWPNSGTKHQKDWPFIVITNFSETDEAIVCFNISDVAKYIEFSTDGIIWYNIQNRETIFYYSDTNEYRITIGGRRNSRKSVYFRGSNYNDNKSLYGFTILAVAAERFDGYTNPDVHCFGNIMSLLDYQTIPTEITTDHCFGWLFSPYGYPFSGTVKTNPNVLKSANILYADKLSTRCYSAMFELCTSLVEAPELPATTLAEACYSGMFAECTSLVKAPELPAQTLANNCYYAMFKDCTSLVTAPELPATELAPYCYDNMFRDCTSLIEAPELPATTLADHCYQYMFRYCTALVKAPEIHATELAGPYCCREMFRDCISLVTAPKLLAQTLAEHCYESMFESCHSLVKAPEIHSISEATRSFKCMFKNCKSLVEIPWIPSAVSSYCYESMFENCTSLTQAIVNFNNPSSTATGTCAYMFKGCKSLNYVKLPFDSVSGYIMDDKIYGYFAGWLEGVSETGTFVKSKDAPWGNSSLGIPEGWTVITE